MRTNWVFLALALAGAAVGLYGSIGCGCAVDCAIATPSVIASASVVKVVADPPCIADVSLVPGGVQIAVRPNAQQVSGDLSCQVYAWLSDGTELVASASFQAGSGPCCSNVYGAGTLSQFAPLEGSSS
jgi:hypothetical protein